MHIFVWLLCPSISETIPNTHFHGKQFQGLSTGVLLLKLKNMRESGEFKENPSLSLSSFSLYMSIIYREYGIIFIESMENKSLYNANNMISRWIQCWAVKRKNGGFSWEISSKEWLGPCWTRLVACHISSYHPLKRNLISLKYINHISDAYWCKLYFPVLFGFPSSLGIGVT